MTRLPRAAWEPRELRLGRIEERTHAHLESNYKESRSGVFCRGGGLHLDPEFQAGLRLELRSCRPGHYRDDVRRSKQPDSDQRAEGPHLADRGAEAISRAAALGGFPRQEQVLRPVGDFDGVATVANSDAPGFTSPTGLRVKK